MKKIALAFMTMALLAGCGSAQKNEIKLKLSDAAAKQFKSISDKEFAKEGYAGMPCDIQVEAFSDKLKKGVDNLLKAQREQKSIIGEGAKLLCKSLLSSLIPKLMSQNYDQYSCYTKAFGYKMSGISDKVCDKIKL